MNERVEAKSNTGDLGRPAMEYSMFDEQKRQGQQSRRSSSSLAVVVSVVRPQDLVSSQKVLCSSTTSQKKPIPTSVHTCDRGPPPVPGWISMEPRCLLDCFCRSRAVSVEPLGTTQWVEVLLLLDARQTKLRLFILSMTELHHATARVIIKKVDISCLFCVAISYACHSHSVFFPLTCLVLSWIQTFP